MNPDKYPPPFPRYPEYMNGRLKKIDMEARLLDILKGVADKQWYPEWDDKERDAAKRVLHNALDVLEEFDY
tara:strand:- start:33 stop:245 length:213 start_codon:yes stop_codon:yes gene_type:complete